MKTLQLNEMFLFEEVTGVTWHRALPRLQPVLCQRHRMAVNDCRACGRDAVVCKTHSASLTGCEDCQPAEMPSRYLAALGWILTRRDDPDLTFDDYAANHGISEALAALGNAVGGVAGTASPPNTANGSRRSSTGSRASRSKATKR